MADILTKPTVKVNGYKCVSAEISCVLNRPIVVRATICSGDTDGSILTTNDIMNLAKDMQAKIFEDPEEGDIQITLNDGHTGELSYNRLIITSCDVVASTRGGLMATITATSPDILADSFDPSVYMKNIDVGNIIWEIAASENSKSQDHLWVYTLGRLNDTDSPLATKILKLIQHAKNKYKFSANMMPGSDSAIESQLSLNNSSFTYVRRFLNNSTETTDVLNGNADLNETGNRAIYNTLASRLFNNGGGIFTKILNSVNSDFLLWYVPDHKSGNMGKLRNWNYEGEDVSTISLPVSTFNFAIGRSLGNDLPPTMVTFESPEIYTIRDLAGEFTSWAVGAYPEKPEKILGKVYNIQAPPWLCFGLYDDPDNGAENMNKGRNPQETEIINEKIKKQLEKDAKAYYPSLQYLARQSFFRYKYGTSVGSLSCPFYANIDAEIGDFVQVNAMGGGKIMRGILSSVVHSLDTGSLSTKLGFTRIEL